METLQKLWFVAEQEALRIGDEFYVVFGGAGLFLERPLESSFDGYENTPINTSTFAKTGGEGVHFGLIHENGQVKETSPVVMTVPVNDEDPYVIVGENLLEFLRLGCQAGYFSLEQLVYDKEDTINRVYNPHAQDELRRNADPYFAERDRREQEILALLSHEFSLTPWDDITTQLNELNKKYLPLLEIPPG